MSHVYFALLFVAAFGLALFAMIATAVADDMVQGSRERSKMFGVALTLQTTALIVAGLAGRIIP